MAGEHSSGLVLSFALCCTQPAWVIIYTALLQLTEQMSQLASGSRATLGVTAQGKPEPFPPALCSEPGQLPAQQGGREGTASAPDAAPSCLWKERLFPGVRAFLTYLPLKGKKPT